ncbi:fumarylacetoacetate hydrolase family protein (plasmid) [Mycolicibacterium psychrotolerans]|uniref:fumarylacetoacetate hydrolase family protein n=1 Tax=Mycolicibacterium psychrotolerans TaxID=216929 RepID=UPI003D6701C9
MSGLMIGRFERPNQQRFLGVVRSAMVCDVSVVVGADDDHSGVTRLIESWDRLLPELTKYTDDPSATWEPETGLRALPPVTPRQIIQAGANYRQHVIDLALHTPEKWPDGATPDDVRTFMEQVLDTRAESGEPYCFPGLVSTLSGARDDIVLPAAATQPDWEIELGVVIGRRCSSVSTAEALDYVFGYTICNDVTLREKVYRTDIPAMGTDWLAAKNPPTFLPTGPYLVPADSVPDSSGLRLQLSVNDEPFQDGTTGDMIFGVAALISYLSRTVALLPGDLILTGSPAGNGATRGRFLKSGDVISASITGLGTQRNVCVTASKVTGS